MNKNGRPKTELTEGMHRGFTRGYNALPIGKIEEANAKLIAVIKGKTRAKFLCWKNGKTIIPPKKAKQIERVFKEYGITDVWDA